MAAGERVICASDALAEGGAGVRFDVRRAGETLAAFAIRHDGMVRAYLNRCAHVAVELDWQPGQFFDADRNLLICSTHGAEYDPATGRCLGGPCHGAGLIPVAVEERGGKVVLKEEADG
ncbi:MAG: Rieske 2Fe-2S domain-containing protein [Burkholderiales bacterium]|nr:Rieske 2Fe-2S domain-containing protein [Burkholderiales bacterium]